MSERRRLGIDAAALKRKGMRRTCLLGLLFLVEIPRTMTVGE